jgi:hypothetical protein
MLVGTLDLRGSSFELERVQGGRRVGSLGHGPWQRVLRRQAAPLGGIDSGDNVQYRCAEDSVLHIYLSPEHAGKFTATLASGGVDDIERVVDELGLLH